MLSPSYVSTRRLSGEVDLIMCRAGLHPYSFMGSTESSISANRRSSSVGNHSEECSPSISRTASPSFLRCSTSRTRSLSPLSGTPDDLNLEQDCGWKKLKGNVGGGFCMKSIRNCLRRSFDSLNCLSSPETMNPVWSPSKYFRHRLFPPGRRRRKADRKNATRRSVSPTSPRHSSSPICRTVFFAPTFRWKTFQRWPVTSSSESGTTRSTFPYSPLIVRVPGSRQRSRSARRTSAFPFTWIPVRCSSGGTMWTRSCKFAVRSRVPTAPVRPEPAVLPAISVSTEVDIWTVFSESAEAAVLCIWVNRKYTSFVSYRDYIWIWRQGYSNSVNMTSDWFTN